MPELKKSIIATLSYFDIQDHPLTFLELSRYLFKVSGQSRPGPDELWSALQALVLEGRLAGKEDLYFLPGRGNLVAKRLGLYPLYLNRLLRTARFVKILRFVPYVRGLAVSGSLAAQHANEQSDIDFLVVVKRGRIWLARLGLSLITQILGVRRHGRLVANRICLNHYVAEEFELPSDRTLYAATEYAGLLCLLNPPAFDAFLKRQQWMSELLQNPPPDVSRSVLTVKKSLVGQPLLEFIWELLGARVWEKLAKYFQKKRISTGPTVLVSDNELSFHPGSKGQALMDKYRGRTEP